MGDQEVYQVCNKNLSKERKKIETKAAKQNGRLNQHSFLVLLRSMIATVY